MRQRILTTILGWLAVVLILRVLVAILANYPDYFPPHFDSLFLQGREARFSGAYRAAFYMHILSAPFVLFNGLVLLSESVRRRQLQHRIAIICTADIRIERSISRDAIDVSRRIHGRSATAHPYAAA